MSRIIIAGIGPGSPEDMTPAVQTALREADVVVGYKYYFRFVERFLPDGCECIDTGMKRERERAEQAFLLAEEGKTVVVISSGDAGIYGMAPLVYEMQQARCSAVEVCVLPGISAFQKAAALLGAPIGHDLCILSLSDLMTPWSLIERRIRAAALGDFITAVYNPKSHERYWQLYRLREIFLQEGRSADTPVGYVRQAGRPEQEVALTTLGALDPEAIDMFTVLIIGNSQSYVCSLPSDNDGRERPHADARHGRENRGVMITPRGYYGSPTLASPTRNPDTPAAQAHPTPLPMRAGKGGERGSGSAGASIMNESFRTILAEMRHPDVPRWRLWPLLHAIHTTVDFGMEECLWMDERATETLYNKVADGTLKHIVTDVSMAAAGIRKGALQRLGIEVHCYINDPRTAELLGAQLPPDASHAQRSSARQSPPPYRAAAEEGLAGDSLPLTRSQAAMRLAAQEHPDALYVVGNAPTALFEICALVRKGLLQPAGIIAAPVGFVHVCESKHAVKTLTHIPKLIVEGRKGGSNLAATLTNAILTYDDAAQLQAGRDV